VTTLSTAHAEASLAAGADPASALVDGFQRGLVIAAIMAAVTSPSRFPRPGCARTQSTSAPRPRRPEPTGPWRHGMSFLRAPKRRIR